MNIVQLTPGTGNFHCGTCLRDHAVVKQLQGMGHNTLMVPLYMPFVTDGTDASDSHTRIFYGGVSVYLEQKSGLLRRMPRFLARPLSRMVNAPFLLRFFARFAGSTKASELGDITISMLNGEHGHQSRELDDLIEWLKTQPKPDVICLSNGLLVGMAKRLKEAFDAPVVCFLQGEDAFLDALPEPQRGECWKLNAERSKDVDGFIGVSQFYADKMAERLSLKPEQMHVVYNGIDIEGFEVANTPPNPPVIGFMARMIHGKGIHQLVDAFIQLKQRDRIPGLKLKIAGAKTNVDDAFITEQKKKLADAGFADDATFHPNVTREEKLEFLRDLSVLSVPTVYDESFGLYLLEAWAAGVPVVQPRRGAFPELVERTNAGVIVEPDNVDALANALEILLLRPEDAKGLGANGRKHVEEYFNIERMAKELETVFDKASASAPSVAAET